MRTVRIALVAAAIAATAGTVLADHLVGPFGDTTSALAAPAGSVGALPAKQNANAPPPAPAPAPPPDRSSVCASAGQQTVIVSSDGRVGVKVFPTMSRNVRITIRKPVDTTSLPGTPGQRVDDLIFQLTAEYCEGGGLNTLPAEVNLGAMYTDQEAAGLNESNFTLALLSGNQWTPTAKQAPDPSANYVSATITEMGYYAVYQR